MRTRALAAVYALAAVALAAVLTGCGGSAGEAVGLESVAHAATKTAEAGSSRVELRMAMDVGGESLEFQASGAFDYDRQRGRMVMEMPFLDGEIEFIADGSLFFFGMPEGMPGAPLPAGKRWLKLDLEEAGALAGFDYGALSQAQQQNPAQILEYLRAAAGEPEKVGEEQIRGVATTRYRGQVDLRKALEQQLGGLPEDQQAKLRESLEAALDAYGTDSVPVDVWVDGDGLLRRMSTEMRMAAGEAGSMSMRVSMDLFDFGVTVDLEHPPAAEVLDLPELMGRAGGG